MWLPCVCPSTVCSCESEHFFDETGLTDIPEGDWFCGPCDSARAKKPVKAAKSSKATKAAAAAAVEEATEKPTAKKGRANPKGEEVDTTEAPRRATRNAK